MESLKKTNVSLTAEKTKINEARLLAEKQLQECNSRVKTTNTINRKGDEKELEMTTFTKQPSNGGHKSRKPRKSRKSKRTRRVYSLDPI